MSDQQAPKSRPQPPGGAPDPSRPSVYGDQWGSSGKQGEAEKGQPDRPEPIETPEEPQGRQKPAGPPPG